MKEILVLEAKDETRYFDTSTDELKYRAAYKILCERFELGYYHEPQPLAERLVDFKYAYLTDEEIKKTPDGIREGVQANRRHELRQVDSITAEFKQESLFWRCLMEILTLPEHEALNYKYNKMSKIPLVWALLKNREEHQYEGFKIVKIESI